MPKTNFQDTFTKTEGDKNLQYDDSAFYFFASSVLLIFGISLFVSIYRQFRQKKKVRLENHKTCECINCHSKLADLVKFRKHKTSFYLKIALLCLIFSAGWKCVTKAAESKGFKGFDPWEIMDLIPGTPKDQIKSKYKQLALKLHPDRNREDEDAVLKLILLNKAYSCLIDPEGNTNCGNFGNNESGNNAFEVGIALPSFLLKKKNRLIILALFFILILIVLPLIVMCVYKNADNVDDNGISMRSVAKSIDCFRNENILFKNFLEIIVQADEMEPHLGAKKYQIRDLESLRDPDFVPKLGEMRFRAYLKPFYLLLAYMTGKPIPPSLQEDLCNIIKVSYRIIDSLFDFSITFYLNKQLSMNVLGKELSFQIIERLILFTQHFYQGLWLHDSSLLQMPSFKRENIDFLKRKLKKVESLKDFRKQENIDQKLQDLFSKDLTVEVKNDIIALDSISQFVIEPKVFVDNDGTTSEEVRVGDVFTIKIDIKRINKNKGFIHSNRFPFLKRETILVLIFDNFSKNVVDYKKITSLEEVMKIEYKEFARSVGSLSWKICVKSDCYIDIDEEVDFMFVVERRNENNGQLYEMHPEDEKALKETTFMKSLIDDVKGKEVDSDDELEHPEKTIKEEEEEEIKEDKR